MPELTALLAAGADFGLFIFAVVAFIGIAVAINKVQRWWEELNHPTTRRPGSPPTVAPPRPRPPGQRPRPATSLPRPLIREELPDARPTMRPPTVRGPAPPPRTTRPPRPAVAAQKPRPPRPVEAREKPVAPARVSAPASSTIAAAQDAVRPHQVGSEAARRDARAMGLADKPVSQASLRMSAVSAVSLSPEELRKAIILNEVLSPPLALRDS